MKISVKKQNIRFDVDKMERILTVYNKKTGKIINEIPFEFADKKLLKKLGVVEE